MVHRKTRCRHSCNGVIWIRKSTHANRLSRPAPFSILTRVSLHELSHAISKHISPYSEKRPYEARFEESLAELFAHDALKRNHLSAPGYFDSIMAAYDKRSIILPFREKYQPSAAMSFLRERYPDAPDDYNPQSSFRFKDLRDSYLRCVEAMEATYDRKIDHIPRQSLNGAMEMVWIDIAKKYPSPYSAESIVQINKEVTSWIIARSTIFPDAHRAQAGLQYTEEYDRLEKKYKEDAIPVSKQVYPRYETTNIRPADIFEKSVALAWIQQSKTGDPLETKIAKHLLQDMNRFAETQGLDYLDASELAILLNTPQEISWATRLASGEKLKDVMPQMKEAIRDSLADAYNFMAWSPANHNENLAPTTQYSAPILNTPPNFERH